MNTGSAQSVWVLFALFIFIAASVWLGMLAQRAMDKGRFLEGFFLGNRGLGAWALALTATVQSGGTFMGFPSLVYAHGWIVTLWIGSYMVVPLTGFAIVGKRLAQLTRKTGAITIPDLLRDRYKSPALGVTASLLIMLLMTIMMIAQFKAGALVMKLAWPGSGMLAFSEDVDASGVDAKYFAGLAIFSLTVIGYTMIGGFLASVWTDLFQSVMMIFGVLMLVCLAVPAAGGLKKATLVAVEKASSAYAAEVTKGEVSKDADYLAAVEQTSSAYASGPGFPSPLKSGVQHQFLPMGLATSMFFVWIWGGFASPASIVRVMAAQNTEVIRKSIALLALYNCAIYIPLIMICISARAIMPDLKSPDETIPRMAISLTSSLPGGPFLAGLILAAPFGAVMATVSCYLLVIASGVVKDIYLRFLRPDASDREIRTATSVAMVGVGAIAIIANLKPVPFLQALVVMSTAFGASSLVWPVLMACYWRRATAAGATCSMVAGAATTFVLYGLGWLHTWALAQPPGEGVWNKLAALVVGWLGPDQGIGIVTPLHPYYLLGFDPMVWGLLVSGVVGFTVSKLTSPPPPEHVSWLFDKNMPRPAE